MKKTALLIISILLFSNCSKNENTLHEQQENIVFGLGLIKSPPEELKTRTLYSYPANGQSFTIPNFYDLSQFMPPVRSQGSELGSCSSWATGYYLKSYHEKKEKGYSYNNDNSKLMSPSFIFNQVKSNPSDCSKGSTIISNLKVLKEQGICSWSSMPYNENDCNELPNSGQIQLAEDNKIQSYFFMYSSSDSNYSMSPENIIKYTKRFISKDTPVIIAYPLDGSFQETKPLTNNEYIYKNYSQNDFVGYHAVLLVGYDNSKNAFKAINSWGKSWGNNGYFWFDYNLYASIVLEVWTTKDIIKSNNCSNFYIGPGYKSSSTPGTSNSYPLTTNFSHGDGYGISGGTEPFLYKMIDVNNNTATNWQSSSKFTIPSKGRYSFIVKDSNGCETRPVTQIFD